MKPTYALATFQLSGEFNSSLREWEEKPQADLTFINFHSIGKGIANSMTDKEAEQLDHFEAREMIIVELANTCKNKIQSTSRR
ncbi:hypothetical protein ACHAW6_003574 [Cyclotella cf. meneghiniana]